MTYISEAHARLLAGLAQNKPATFSNFSDAEEFEAQAEHIKTLASLWIEYLHALASDGRASAPGNEINTEVTGYVGDALSDFAAQFEHAAEKLREDEDTPRSDFAEHNTHSYALSGAK